ncbi:MAG TPA: YggT family protein [Rhizomicrobium sp.]|jgi:YggT family protein|nr:YggT family protein [Rhizomicrobium sp.]
MVNPIVSLILLLLNLYEWIVIAAVVASWLVVFNVVNVSNQIVRSVLRALDAMTDPVFRQVRRVIPPLGGLDLSPLVVLIGLWFLQQVLVWIALRGGFYYA